MFTVSPTFLWTVWRRCLGSWSRGRSVAQTGRLSEAPHMPLYSGLGLRSLDLKAGFRMFPPVY